MAPTTPPATSATAPTTSSRTRSAPTSAITTTAATTVTARTTARTTPRTDAPSPPTGRGGDAARNHPGARPPPPRAGPSLGPGAMPRRYDAVTIGGGHNAL